MTKRRDENEVELVLAEEVAEAMEYNESRRTRIRGPLEDPDVIDVGTPPIVYGHVIRRDTGTAGD